jgi:hypothetical protein
LFQLNQTIPSNIYPVSLSYLTEEDYQGGKVKIAGFGKTSTGKISQFLEKVEMRLLSTSECEERISSVQKHKFVLTNQYICAISTPPALLTHVRISVFFEYY